jgi:hypothetical protein
MPAKERFRHAPRGVLPAPSFAAKLPVSEWPAAEATRIGFGLSDSSFSLGAENTPGWESKASSAWRSMI